MINAPDIIKRDIYTNFHSKAIKPPRVYPLFAIKRRIPFLMIREFTAKVQTITDEIITVDVVEDGLAKLNDTYEKLEKLNAPVPEHAKIETLARIM